MSDSKLESSYKREVVLNWVERILKSKGFNVVKDWVIESDGVSHRFDLFAEYDPIPGLKVLIGFIVAMEPVNVELVEKIIGWITEFKRLKITILALNDVESEAETLASHYGIDIVRIPEEVLKNYRVERIEPNIYHVKPKVKIEEVIEEIRDEFKPGSRRVFRKICIVYYPLLVFKVKLPVVNIDLDEASIIESDIVFDGIHGCLITSSGLHFKFKPEYGSFNDLPDEVYSILKIVSSYNRVELSSLTARLRYDQYKLKTLLNELSIRGLIDIYGDLVEYKGINQRDLVNMDEWLKRCECEVVAGRPVGENIVVLEPSVSIFKLEEFIRSINGVLEDFKILYIPLYVGLVDEVRNGVIIEKLIVYDAMDKSELEQFSTRLTIPEIIEKIKEVKCQTPT